jgi:O-antigen/teichoic acid export membrane protein
MNMLTTQSTKNLAGILLGFGIGAVNTLVLYPWFFGAEKQGLVVFLLSASNLLMPLIGFGVAQTIIKFHSSYPENDKQGFLSYVVLLPLIVAFPLCFVAIFFHDAIAALLAVENPIIASYTWVIFSIAFATAYFEVFYSWARVHFKSVAGNTLKEIYPRVSILALLLLYAANGIDLDVFFYLLVGLYYLRLLLMVVIAFRIQPPKFSWQKPKNLGELLRYSLFLVLAASAGSLIIDIDKFMLPQYKAIEQTAFYAVAIFTATLIEAPGRALFQILNPLIAKNINEKNTSQLAVHYKNSSINLLLLAGWIFLLVNGSITSLFALIEDANYANAIWVVLAISLTKLITMSSGASNTMLINSKKYHVSLLLTIFMAVFVVLGNYLLIPKYGINGAAVSTLVVVVVFTYVRMGYVYYYFKIQPYGLNTLYAFAQIAIFYWALTFLHLDIHPFLSIVVKSVFITLVYGGCVYVLNLSPTLRQIVQNRFKRP